MGRPHGPLPSVQGADRDSSSAGRRQGRRAGRFLGCRACRLDAHRAGDRGRGRDGPQFIAVCLVFTIVISPLLLLLIIYVGIFVAISWIALAMHLCHVRGNGIKVGSDQLPKVYESARRAAKALGLAEAPDVYVIQEGGVLNAFATKWAFRSYIVLYSDLVDACGDDSGELDMIVAHEMGHLALKHITWHWILLPAMMVPFLSQAYSRACEYSADRCGWTGCRDKQAAMRGLIILAAGGHCGRMASLEAFLKQRNEVDGFWQIVVGLFSTHPWLTHRVEAVSRMAAPPAHA
jgi:Zn-dependent protease with chaperone function